MYLPVYLSVCRPLPARAPAWPAGRGLNLSYVYVPLRTYAVPYAVYTDLVRYRGTKKKSLAINNNNYLAEKIHKSTVITFERKSIFVGSRSDVYCCQIEVK